MGPLSGDLSSQKKGLGMTEHPNRLEWSLQRALGGFLLLFGELRDVAEPQGGVHWAAAGSVGEASDRGEIEPEVQSFFCIHQLLSAIRMPLCRSSFRHQTKGRDTKQCLWVLSSEIFSGWGRAAN